MVATFALVCAVTRRFTRPLICEPLTTRLLAHCAQDTFEPAAFMITFGWKDVPACHDHNPIVIRKNNEMLLTKTMGSPSKPLRCISVWVEPPVIAKLCRSFCRGHMRRDRTPHPFRGDNLCAIPLPIVEKKIADLR